MEQVEINFLITVKPSVVICCFLDFDWIFLIWSKVDCKARIYIIK